MFFHRFTLWFNSHKRNPPLYSHENIIKIMRNSTSKRTNCLHFLGLLKKIFKFFLICDISQKIESDMQYPGQIKVTVIREMRAVNYAK